MRSKTSFLVLGVLTVVIVAGAMLTREQTGNVEQSGTLLFPGLLSTEMCPPINLSRFREIVKFPLMIVLLQRSV